MKKKNLLTNRILIIALVLVMVAGMLPVTALAAEEEVKYAVWIGGEEFTSEKLIIQGDTGTATYDPNTKTLTLDNYTYTGDGLDEDWLSVLICAYDDLNIVLKGENKLISTCDCHSYCYGIYNGNGFTTIIGEDAQSDSLLVQSKGERQSVGIFTFSKGIRVETCTLTVKSAVEGDSNIAMYHRGETFFRNCTVDVFCANAEGVSYGIFVTNDINMEESTVTVSAAGSEAIIGKINLIYPGGYAWKVSRDVEFTTEPFAYNQESYVAIKPEAFMATWTDGEGASYEKTFRYGEVIPLPTSTFFEETFRRGGYTLTEWQGYTEGMTMPMGSVTFTAVYTPNQYTVTFDPNGAEAIDPLTVIYGEKYGTLPSSAITGLSGGNKNWYLVDADGNVTDTNIKNLSKVTVARDHNLFIKRNVLAPTVNIALSVPGGLSDSYQYYISGASQRVLTATVGNQNADILDYTYQWYKDGMLIEGATSNVLTLDGNVSDSGTYKVEVTATLKDGTGIVVTNSSATGSKEQKVKILHATNTLSYDANGGEGGPTANYTGGTTATVSEDTPTRENYIFQGWNTKADGSGESYEGGDTYTFRNDNGNGGCTVTLYAQWKGENRTVTYMIDGEIFKTDTVEYAKDAVLPEIPQKDGYTGIWNHDGKNITVDTVISAVYTINEYTITFMDENGVYKTLTVKHGEPVTMPDVPIKDGYTVTWETTIDKATGDAIVNAVYTEIPKTDTPNSTNPDTPSSTKPNTESSIETNTESSIETNTQGSPKTGDNSNMMLWFALLLASVTGFFGITLYDRKRKIENKR